MLEIGRQIKIPFKELTFSFSRSSGPGGQNVNKVNSKVTLRFDLKNSPSLSQTFKSRFEERYNRRLTESGELIIQSSKYRDQSRNIADCLEKLSQLLQTVAVPPKKRKATKPTKASVQKRLDQKKHRAERKKNRKLDY